MKISEAPPPSVFAGWLKPVAVITCAAVLVIAIGLTRQRETPARGAKPGPTNSPSRRIRSMQRMHPARRSARLSRCGTRRCPVEECAVWTCNRSADLPASARSALRRSRRTAAARGHHRVDRCGRVSAVPYCRREFRFIATFDETPEPIPWVITDLSISPITIEPQPGADDHITEEHL